MASPPNDSEPSSPFTPNAAPTSRVPIHRSVSHSSQWSVADTPQHHNYGTSYSTQNPRPVSPSPRRHPGLVRSLSSSVNKRSGVRSASASSRHGRAYRDDVEMLSEDEELSGDDEPRSLLEGRHGKAVAGNDGEGDEDDEEDEELGEEDPITLKDRQSLINVEHPFGLPIWKPALYKKSRSVTRYADQALHSVPSAQAERHLLVGNVLWTIVFGWWLACVCFIISGVLFILPYGGRQYSALVFGLGWYLGWPFGKYVEGDFDEDPFEDEAQDLSHESGVTRTHSGSDADTVRAVSPLREEPSESRPSAPSSRLEALPEHVQTSSWASQLSPTAATPLLGSKADVLSTGPHKSYGTNSPYSTAGTSGTKPSVASEWLGHAVFWLALVIIIAPLMLVVCALCWGLIVAIPMAKLNWALVKHLFQHPTSIRFCSAPSLVVLASDSTQQDPTDASEDGHSPQTPIAVNPRLAAGQLAPSGSPTSKVLLCIYRAIGFKYYKYTVGGVNIIFINLLPLVFFVILDGLLLLPMADRRERAGQHVPWILATLASRALIFTLSLLSVIPLSYFIGMAVASISAQSSIGMGAVINATFGSIIEILLYAIALTQGKGRLVEGSIIGSILAGVLLMPGLSMVSGALRRKEQKFNARSAGVTSTMLIMAIIGTLTPTLFYQTYGNVRLLRSSHRPEHWLIVWGF